MKLLSSATVVNMDVRTEPNNERAAMNKKLYEDMIKEQQQQQQQPGDSSGVAKFVNKKSATTSHDFVNYERLCRGEETHVSLPLPLIFVSHVDWRRNAGFAVDRFPV